MQASGADLFIRACWRKPVETTPVWLMRQAGRVLPAYRELRERYGFKQLSGDPELTATVTLMPLDEFDVDAAILFADIMTPLATLGIDFDIKEGGPVVHHPLRDLRSVETLRWTPAAEAVPEVMEAVRTICKQLDARLPLIGFAGAPFTLASYIIEGGPSRDLSKTKALMYNEPETWKLLMSKLTDMVIDYVGEQVRAGASAFQIFDSWVGVLGPNDYIEHVLPHSRRIFDETSALGVPRIHFGTGNATFFGAFGSAGSEVVGVDWRMDIAEAWEAAPAAAIQGNMDPAVLLGPRSRVIAEADRILDRIGGRPGHIFNLGHGVLPNTPLDNIKVLIETVHSRRHSA
ncbi:MAG: uroporphyrinogen decarboxylase [Actinomycetota bacterium]|nr:uroporphyrinogen decarboxylase [Actinomycetota bacterium]